MGIDKTDVIFGSNTTSNTKDTQENQSRGENNIPKGEIPRYEEFKKDFENKKEQERKKSQRKRARKIIFRRVKYFSAIVLFLLFCLSVPLIESYIKKVDLKIKAENIISENKSNSIELRNIEEVEIQELYLRIKEKEQRAEYLRKKIKKDEEKYLSYKNTFNEIK